MSFMWGGGKWMTYFFEMQKRRKMKRTNFQQKWLQINEEIAYTKLTSNTKTLELENMGKYLYKTKRKWGHREEKLVQNGKEKIL